jgi:hypothetical protein
MRMTESDWSTRTDPQLMLSFLQNHGATERKLRLFAVACCRRELHAAFAVLLVGVAHAPVWPQTVVTIGHWYEKSRDGSQLVVAGGYRQVHQVGGRTPLADRERPAGCTAETPSS